MTRRRSRPAQRASTSTAALATMAAVLACGVESFFSPGGVRPSPLHNINTNTNRFPNTGSAAIKMMRAAPPPIGPPSRLAAVRSSLHSGRSGRSSSSSPVEDDGNYNSGGIGRGWGGGGGGGGDDGCGGGDEGFHGRRQQQPELFLAAGGLAGALDGLKEALRNLRLPWNRQDEPTDSGAESEAKSRERMEADMAKVLVADVVVDESVIPRDVLASAAVKSGLLGREASAARIQACVTILNQWYQYEGYLLSSVSDAVLSVNGTISFSVVEPVVSSTEPVKLLFFKAVNASDPASELTRVEKGKTRPRTIARGLGLKGGEHFRVDGERWKGVLNSGLFNGAQLSGAHQTAGATGATLDVNVEESRTVVFEPGVTKTLFDSNWAGEVCFEERNVLGLNGVLGLDIRRTMASPFTSYSIRLGNNRFGQPGAWQVSLFRDTIAPRSGLGGGAGGYANSAIGTASSAPVFSTASPAGTPRDLGILARSIKGVYQGGTAASGNSTRVAAEASGDGGVKGKDAGLSRCHGVSLSTSWPFSFVRATLGAGYQQVLPPKSLFDHQTPHASAQNIGGGSGGNGALDVITLSGGLSKHWRLPGVLKRLGGSAKQRPTATRSDDRSRGRGRGGGGAGRGGSGDRGGAEMEGSMSWFLDVKTGCLLEGTISPRPFTQELATLVQRIPVGPNGRAGSWNVTLNVRQQVQHCSEDTPLHQVPPFGGQRTVRGFGEGELGRAKEYALTTAEVRVPLRNLLGKLSAQAVVFLDMSAFRPVTWQRAASSGAGRAEMDGRGYYSWDTARGPSGGGLDGAMPQGKGAQPEEAFRAKEGAAESSEDLENAPIAGASPSGGVGRREAPGQWYSPPPSGGIRVQGGRGVGLRIGDLIQVDVGISRSGTKQVHIGLVDRNF